MSHRKCRARTRSAKRQRQSRTPRWHCAKNDSGSYAVFAEQGSSASQMTAAKVMDVIAGLPDCDGQAADTVSAYTQVGLEDAPRLLKIPKSECPDIWMRLQTHLAQILVKHWRPCGFFLERNLCGHLLDSCGKDSSKKFCWNLDGKRVPNWECLCWSKAIIIFGRFSWMTWEWLEGSGICLPCGRNCEKTLTWTNQHHVLTMYIWDVLDVNANRTTLVLSNTEKCSNHELLLEQLKKITGVGQASRKDRCVVPRHGRTCSQMRWEILRTGNKKDRANVHSCKPLLGYSMVSEQTCTINYNMTKACDKRLSRLISYIHHTCEYKQYC